MPYVAILDHIFKIALKREREAKTKKGKKQMFQLPIIH